jgi:predicted ArsR family transcriptional regulator
MFPADAIANPIRLTIVRHLAVRDAASLTELASSAGVHPNTARPHLRTLEEAGVIERFSESRGGRGRPRIGYRLVGEWTLDGQRPGGLSGLLAAALLRAGLTAKELRDLGADWGRYLVGPPGAHDPGRELPRALGALGFDAAVVDRTIELTACPCPVVSPSRPGQICELADGVIDGVLAASGGELEATQAAHDPDRRHCTVSLERSGSAGRARYRGRKRTQA